MELKELKGSTNTQPRLEPLTGVLRRDFLRTSAFFAAAAASTNVLAETLSLTPKMTEGPFYPDKLPLDTDNDLLKINDSIDRGVGEITHLSGKILDINGAPVRNAVVEIWQTDNNGVYIHSRSNRRNDHDGNFQGFGRFATSSKGEYYFRTIKPAKYPGRTPHIHYRVVTNGANGQKRFSTQCFINGNEQNADDGLIRRVGKGSELLMVDFKPLPGSTIGELTAEFNIVLGKTPEDA